MKRLILAAAIAAGILAAAPVFSDDEVMGPEDARGVIVLPGDGMEPPPDTSIQGTHDQYCLGAQQVAKKITQLRDQGAPEEYPVQVMYDNGGAQFIWVARQVYWRQNIGKDAEHISFYVWKRCEDENMSYRY